MAGFQADMARVAAHMPAQGEFYGLELCGKQYRDKEAAGEALLEAYKSLPLSNVGITTIGSYKGFSLSLSMENFGKELTMTLKGVIAHKITLGIDARGNLTRMDNALAGMSDRAQVIQDQLDNLVQQQESAKMEIGKPFPQEAELSEKSARLAALDAMLNMDARHEALEETPEEEVAAEKRPSVMKALNAPKRNVEDRDDAPIPKPSREVR